MARSGRGLSWSPNSQVFDHLASGRLERVAAFGDLVDIEIRIWRPKNRQSGAAEALWSRFKAYSGRLLQAT